MKQSRVVGEVEGSTLAELLFASGRRMRPTRSSGYHLYQAVRCYEQPGRLDESAVALSARRTEAYRLTNLGTRPRLAVTLDD